MESEDVNSQCFFKKKKNSKLLLLSQIHQSEKTSWDKDMTQGTTVNDMILIYSENNKCKETIYGY